jgi:eukaryotic-like serine/threonine-protein kinase
MENTQIDPGQAPRGSTDSRAELRSIGDYRILRLLGEGGMGAVYLGYNEKDGQQVAIKVLSDQLARDQGFIDRFYREAKSGALLNHPNIVRSITAGQDAASHNHYLVLEYVDGPSVQALLTRLGRFSVGDAVYIVLDVARGLEHAHSRNLIHRDIKPDNILLTRSGVAKLVDFGLAKRIDEASHLTGARQTFGTTPYMPYEQALTAKNADGRSDIYALGATLYHLLTGKVPFPGDNHVEVVEMKDRGDYPAASSINADIPASLEPILQRMLARHPRHASGGSRTEFRGPRAGATRSLDASAVDQRKHADPSGPRIAHPPRRRSMGSPVSQSRRRPAQSERHYHSDRGTTAGWAASGVCANQPARPI